MKKILFALAIMPLLVMGCSSDDDDKLPAIDFDYSIKMLYGEWRATSVEAVEEDADDIDLTLPVFDDVATYVTFEKGGAFTAKGLFGDSEGGVRNGTYTTKGKIITATMGDETLSFEMTSLNATTAKIKLAPNDLVFPGMEDLEIDTVTVVLTKQTKE